MSVSIPLSFRPASASSVLFAALLTLGVQTARAVTLFTENFSTGSVNWKIDTLTPPTEATWVSTGGADGGGYITRMSPATGGAMGTVIFRGQGNYDSSADGFVGNWISLGVDTFTVAIRHEGTGPLSFNIRFATAANSPGASTQNHSIAPGLWETITIPITDSVGAGGVFQTYGGGSFNAIFSAVSNVQITLASTLPASPVALSIDSPTISGVPEPTASLLGVAALSGLMLRRRR